MGATLKIGIWVGQQREYGKNSQNRQQRQQQAAASSAAATRNNGGSNSNNKRRIQKHKLLHECSYLSQERYEKLQGIGFVWKVWPKRGWDENLRLLREYKDSYGDCNVPQHWPQDKTLGKFVARQRYIYAILQRMKHDGGNGGVRRGTTTTAVSARAKKDTAHLTPERIEQLNGKFYNKAYNVGVVNADDDFF